MKEFIKKSILILLILFPISVFAAGGISVSPNSLTIEEGSTKTFTITASNTIGDVGIISNNTNIATVSTSEWATGMVEENQTKMGTITVNGKKEGTTTITLKIDAATFDGEDLSGQTRTITVNVVAKASPTPTNSKPVNVTDTRSKNNNIKDLTVDGYKLLKVDNNNYALTVSPDVTNINIKATTEDPKAKIVGLGSHEITIGENNIEIIVTAENGTKNKISIKVTRRDGYYLEDLESLLNSNIEDININIKSDTIISAQNIEKIKDSKKVVNFNFIDENKNVIYSWIINGSKIIDVNDFITTVLFETEHKKDISRLSNYAEGLTIKLLETSHVPTKTQLKVFVGNKYNNDELINVYTYIPGNGKLELVSSKIKVENGYIKFDIIHTFEYLITMSEISNSLNAVSDKKLFSHATIVIALVSLLIIIIIIYNKKIKVEQ